MPVQPHNIEVPELSNFNATNLLELLVELNSSLSVLKSVPDENSDSSQGFKSGSIALVGSDLYICTDASEGSAVWSKMVSTANVEQFVSSDIRSLTGIISPGDFPDTTEHSTEIIIPSNTHPLSLMLVGTEQLPDEPNLEDVTVDIGIPTDLALWTPTRYNLIRDAESFYINHPLDTAAEMDLSAGVPVVVTFSAPANLDTYNFGSSTFRYKLLYTRI